MLTYRRIEKEPFPEIIWEAEEQLPDWFRSSSHVWTPDYPSFCEFWQSCPEIWGLFRGDDLHACVYLEFPKPQWANIHVSVIRETPEDDLVRFFRSLKYAKAQDGIRIMEAWILDANRPLRRIARRAGFDDTGLVMTHGEYKGRALHWSQVRG